jgi:hypothetical protein
LSPTSAVAIALLGLFIIPVEIGDQVYCNPTPLLLVALFKLSSPKSCTVELSQLSESFTVAIATGIFESAKTSVFSTAVQPFVVFVTVKIYVPAFFAKILQLEGVCELPANKPFGVLHL